MKLLFKQRLFSWLDSYDVFNESGDVVFTVKGQLAWGHCLAVYDAQGRRAGTVKEEIFTFLPRFRIYVGEGDYVGEIRKDFTFFTPHFSLDYNNWAVQGDFFAWDYQVTDGGTEIMTASKQLFNFTDTYAIEVQRPENALYCLMIVLAIDAAKCSSNGG